MANTFQDYTATAEQTDFAFTFDYLEDEHVGNSQQSVSFPKPSHCLLLI